MTAQSDIVLTNTIEEALNTILRCLDAIEENMQPLQDKVVTLETTV
jgi:ubiquinone biosynthesis protein UbiJ